MDFSEATCFDDLVECNIQFIRGVLKETPSHLDSLCPESLLIIDELTELCEKYRVLTLSSQPSIVEDECRQRGYITGAVKGNLDAFVKILNDVTDLEYIVKCGNRFCSKISIHDDIWWSFTEELDDGKWKSFTHSCINHMTNDSEYKFYETNDYDMIDDDEVIRFTVCEPEFGLDTNHCCTELMKAMNELIHL